MTRNLLNLLLPALLLTFGSEVLPMHLRSNKIKQEVILPAVTKIKRVHSLEEIKKEQDMQDELTILDEELLGCDDWNDEAKRAYTIAFKKIKALPAAQCPPRLAGVCAIKVEAVPVQVPGAPLKTIVYIPSSIRIVPNTIITDTTGCIIHFVA